MAENNIIIKKIKKISGGHHGGAWKVAYADFVTAMMAFFLLLWLLSTSSKDTLSGISDYFQPTIGVQGEKGIGVAGGLADIERGNQNSRVAPAESFIYSATQKGGIIDVAIDASSSEDADYSNLQKYKAAMKEVLDSNDVLQKHKENILVDETPSGLRIQIIDNSEREMFTKETAELKDYAKEILSELAKTVTNIPNYISIEGYIASEEVRDPSQKWLLTSKRAISTMEFLTKNNLIEESQIGRLEARSDKEPIFEKNHDAPENSRIAITILKSSVLKLNKKNFEIKIFDSESRQNLKIDGFHILPKKAERF